MTSQGNGQERTEIIKSDLGRYECIIKYYEENPKCITGMNKKYLRGIAKEIQGCYDESHSSQDISTLASNLSSRINSRNFNLPENKIKIIEISIIGD